MMRTTTRSVYTRRLAGTLALALAVMPWLGALLAAGAVPARDAVLLCTAHGPVLVRIDAATGEVEEVPAAPAAPSHLCCLVSIACAGGALPGAAPAALIAPVPRLGEPLRVEAARLGDLAHRVAANPVRGPPSGLPA